MDEYQATTMDQNWPIVLEKIKARYNEYCIKNRKYQPIPFNSTPEPYQFLAESFKEELSSLLGKSESDVESMVPSTSLFAEMYRIGRMPKGQKLHGCYLYATGKSKIVLENENQENGLTYTAEPETTAVQRQIITNRIKISVILACLFVIAGLSYYIIANQKNTKTPPSGLVIERPTNGKIVPMVALIEGKVSNADIVWIVVRDIEEDVYYVQRPARVKDDGTWSGPVHIGGPNKLHIGKRVQIRAFVNPVKDFVLEDMLYIWPKAELSSNTVYAVRGRNIN